MITSLDQLEQLTESEWGAWVDRSEWMTDTPEWGYGMGLAGGMFGPLPSSPMDRRDGAFYPVFRTEQDLAQIRGDCHLAGFFSSIAIGAVEALQRYIFGKGFTLGAEINKDHGLSVDTAVAQALAAEVKSVIREFEEENQLTICSGFGSLDCEIDSRIRHDGEAPIVLESRLMNGGHAAGTSGIGVKAKLIEPDQITEPADKYKLERWLNLLDRESTSWSFGVHTPRRYTDEVLGLHVVYDGNGDDWDYLPTAVGHPANPRKTCVFAKRNTPRNVKRGLADFFPITGDVARESKLSVRLSKGATLQASIAWIVEQDKTVPPPSSGGQTTGPNGIQSLRGSVTVPTQTGSKQLPALDYPAGSILTTPIGRTYKAGPLGAERNANFLLIADYVLRRIGVRWNAPEYMISGDASNANYSSTLVAESPFVKAREFDQQFHVGVFLRVLWKVIEFYHMAGRFRRFGIDFPTLKRLIKIIVNAPEVATRDPLTLAEQLAIQQTNGWISPRTASEKMGNDYDSEVTNGAGVASGASTGQQPGQPIPGDTASGEMRGMNMLQMTRYQKQVKGIVDSLQSGATSEDMAREMLDALGMPPSKVDRIVTRVLGGASDEEIMADAGDAPASGPVRESVIDPRLPPYPYGMCPQCGAPGESRERRPNGNDTCEKGCVYPSSSAVPYKADPARESHRNLSARAMIAAEYRNYP